MSTWGRIPHGEDVSGNPDAGATTPFLTAVDAERFKVVAQQLLFSDNHEAIQDFWIGAILETIDIEVTEAAGVVTFSVEQDGGGDLTCVFAAGFFLFDSTPAATISLVVGTDEVHQDNYIFIDGPTGLLARNTTGFPVTEHAPLAVVWVQSAAGVSSNGAMVVHAWTDHASLAGDNGHLAHINKWIRAQPATWESGVDTTLTITTNGGSADNVIATTLEGMVLQLHSHEYPAFDGVPGADTIFVINDFTTKYDEITDLNEALADSAGVTMVGKYFSLVLVGVVNEDTGDCKLMLNVPNGSYNNQSDLDDDISNFAVYSIPAEFTGVGFLIAQFNLRHQAAASGTWTLIEQIDLRGQFPSRTAGGGGGGGGAAPTTFQWVDKSNYVNTGDSEQFIPLNNTGSEQASQTNDALQFCDFNRRLESVVLYRQVQSSGNMGNVTIHLYRDKSGTPEASVSVTSISNETYELFDFSAEVDRLIEAGHIAAIGVELTSAGTLEHGDISIWMRWDCDIP